MKKDFSSLLKTFWNQEKSLVSFVGFIVAVGALFLNIQIPENSHAQNALAHIQVFWLLLLGVGLWKLGRKLISFADKREKELEEEGSPFRVMIPAFVLFAVFIWMMSNLLIYILALYQKSVMEITLMLAPIIPLIVGIRILDYLQKRREH